MYETKTGAGGRINAMLTPAERKPASLDNAHVDLTLARAVVAANPSDAKAILARIEVRLANAQERGDAGAVAACERLIVSLREAIDQTRHDIRVNA